MQTQDGQSPCTCQCKASENQSNISEDSIDAGGFTESQKELLKLVYFHGAQAMSQSLRQIHDLALYQSDVPLDREEKDSLYDVMTLSKVLSSLPPS